MIQCNSTRDSRDQKLWEVLPAKDAPYDYNKISDTELAALVEALGDGFGETFVPDREPMPLPHKVKSGLLDHRFYVAPNSAYNPEPSCDEDVWDDAFWSSANSDDAPPPCEWFPVKFQTRRLGVYFRNQYERFCEHLILENAELRDLDRSEDGWVFDCEARRRFYQKPWYEFHAVQFLDWIADRDILRHAGLAMLVNTSFAGQLGRLVEQYYWRFRFESSAITGIGSRKGASSGGRVRANHHRGERHAWQTAAREIWARRPALSKIAVAETIRKKLSLRSTAKHIARYIDHP